MTITRVGATLLHRIPVALIDDHLLFRQCLGAWLAAEGAEVDVVGSVRTVRELRATSGWGAFVVVLELQLADGSAVQDNIGALLAAGSRVVVLSTEDDPALVRAAVRAGAMAHVPKVASAGDLLAAIRATADGSVFMSQELASALLADFPLIRPRLSPQELRTLRWYAGGMPMKSVALRLGVTEGAVKSYVDRIRDKYEKAGRDAPTKVDLYKRAIEDGYLSTT